MADAPPTITVIAGTNGAGKSSLIGAFIRARGGAYYNPDEAARALREANPRLGELEANGLARTLGRQGLDAAIAHGRDFALETTLGGETIPARLGAATDRGLRVRVWHVGLSSPEEHVRRVKARARRGGHDIDERKIRERYTLSVENLVALLPDLDGLRVFDNSETVDVDAGERPRLRSLLHVRADSIVELADPRTMPDWAKPVVIAVLKARGLD